MSEDEYALPSVKRRRRETHSESDNELSEDALDSSRPQRRLRKKQYDIDDIELMDENEERQAKVSFVPRLFNS